MEYSKSFEEQVLNLKKLLLGKITYKEWKREYEKSKDSYKIIFQSEDFKEFVKKMYEFFNNKQLVKKRLAHEKKHAQINKKYGIKSNFVLKSYKREGKIKYRFSVLDAEKKDKKEKWLKNKLWKYNYEQTSINDASDNDKKIRNMLIEIKEKI
jgi:hypothetical protein